MNIIKRTSPNGLAQLLRLFAFAGSGGVLGEL